MSMRVNDSYVSTIWRNGSLFVKRHRVGALAIALLLALSLFVLPSTASARAAAGTGRIYGQLLDGTKRNAPVGGQSGTLQMAQGVSAADLGHVTTARNGGSCFRG